MMNDEKILQEKISLLEDKLNIRERLIHALELVNTTLDLNTVLEMLMTIANQLIDTEASSILLMDEEKGQLYFTAATGTKKDEIKKIYLAKGEGIAGWVAEHGQPLHIADVSKDKRFSKKSDRTTGFITRSILAVPLKIEDKLIGVVEVVNKKKGEKFTSEDIELLQTLSTTGALAIQKARLYQDLSDLFISAVRAIADAIEAKDPYTRGHCERMRHFSLMIAEELNLSEKEKRNVELSALLHDVGKIGVPERILLKDGKLTQEEFEEIKKHPVIGAEILAEIKQLKEVIPGVKYHHERYDGKGYPEGLNGENIPLIARIMAVTDAYDAMTSDRPYRKGLSKEIADKELVRLKGQQFDPKCVDAFLQNYAKNAKYSPKR
jgi:putative nucleotidyltransferase with HDIG domain